MIQDNWSRTLGLWLALGLCVACRRTPAAPATDKPSDPSQAQLAPEAEVPLAPAAAGIAPAPAVPPAAASADHPPLCEVELAGTFTETVGAQQSLAVYIGRDDCLAADARIVGRFLAAESGIFMAEVFVPCGWNLSVCAAIERRDFADEAPKPSRRYAKLGRTLLAEGEGEIEFKDLSWGLQDGPERTWPKPATVGSER